MVFNRSGATRAVTIDISEAFDRLWHTGLLQKLKSYGISGQFFGLTCSFLSHRWLGVVLDGESSQEYPVNAGVPQGSILDDTTLYSRCDQWLVDFNAGKTELVSFHQSNNIGSIDLTMDGSILEEKSSFKMLGVTFSSKLNWGSYIISIPKTASKL